MLENFFWLFLGIPLAFILKEIKFYFLTFKVVAVFGRDLPEYYIGCSIYNKSRESFKIKEVQFITSSKPLFYQYILNIKNVIKNKSLDSFSIGTIANISDGDFEIKPKETKIAKLPIYKHWVETNQFTINSYHFIRKIIIIFENGKKIKIRVNNNWYSKELELYAFKYIKPKQNDM